MKRVKVSCPIKIKASTKYDLDETGEYIKERLPFIRNLSYDEIIWFLILNYNQNRNRGGSK